jgi:hypothetical protein
MVLFKQMVELVELVELVVLVEQYTELLEPAAVHGEVVMDYGYKYKKRKEWRGYNERS